MFKVGDKVKRVKNTVGADLVVVAVGTICTVEGIRDNFLIVNKGYYVKASDFELVKEEKKMEVDLNKPVRTKNGLNVTILSTVAIGAYPVVGQMENSDAIYRWDMKGNIQGHYPSYTLENIPEPPKVFDVYLNMYVNENGVYCGGMYKSRKEADKWSSEDRIACLHIVKEFQPGQLED